jgi:hypothetical protein
MLYAQRSNVPSCQIPCFPFLSFSLTKHLSESHALLDLRNRQRGVQPLGARPRAVKNCVAAVQAHAVVKGVLALGHLLVT